MSDMTTSVNQSESGVTEPVNAFVLTNDNYYSDEANEKYMSVSTFKDFAGTIGHYACEYTALGKRVGTIPKTTSTSLLVGSYVDSYFEGTLDKFKEEHPELFSSKGPTKGQLKADYKDAESIIRRIESDPVFTQYMSGDKQVIMTANYLGIDWKIKMDSYHPGKMIVDLKVMKDMNPIWSDKARTKLDFIRHWGYDIQGAIYQKVVELNTGLKLPFFIACATKEDGHNIEIIEITQPYLDAALEYVEAHLGRVLDIINGKTDAKKCGACVYCRSSKKLTGPITLDEIIAKIPVPRKDITAPPVGDDEIDTSAGMFGQSDFSAAGVSLFD